MNSKNESLWDGWWRWPLVPIASIVGAFLGAAAFMIMQWLSIKFSGKFNESGWYFQYIVPLIRDCLFGFLAVYLGCLAAPRGKLIVGVILTTLIAVSPFFFYLLTPSEVITATWFLSSIALIVGGIIGVIMTVEAS